MHTAAPLSTRCGHQGNAPVTSWPKISMNDTTLTWFGMRLRRKRQAQRTVLSESKCRA